MPTTPRLHLLVVEDDPSIQLLLRRLLQAHFAVHVVADATQALEAARQRTFDLFLLDINLGEGRDGVELLAALRRMPGQAEAPAVACTAYALPQDRERFLSAGFDAFVGKPFTRRHLLAALGRFHPEVLPPGPPRRRPTPA
ncbi:MAG: response regulator [Rhodothermales bacterium]|nr:response regulator [Rhodothermales bacterium]